MKTFFFSILAGILFLAFEGSAFCQDSISQRSQMLDMKLQLLDSKLDLLDTKIKLWESKPKELDIKLSELDSRIEQMDFNPDELNRRLDELDSMVRISLERAVNFSSVQQPDQEVYRSIEQPEEPLFNPVCKSAIMLDPARLPEGTFSLSYERIIDPRFSVNLTGLATYSTDRGISNFYFSNQSFALYNSVIDRYESYEGEVMSGGGFNIQFRNYLLANHPGKRTAPLGLYAAPQFMYRLMKIRGYYSESVPTNGPHYELVKTEVHQHLRILAGGVVLGMKIPVMKVLAVDIFAGGNIRLAKYKDEDGFTKYKNWLNIDFSGVSPVAGISVGILK